MSDLKAVFFDLDDTLCDDAGAWIISAEAAAQIAKRRSGIDAEALTKAFLVRSEEYWMSMEPVTETRALLEIRAAQWAGALQDVSGLSDPALATELGRYYGDRRSREIALYPDALETLEFLRLSGVRLALITNGVRLTHVEKIQYLGLESRFDHVLIADAIGWFKPDPRIFLEACRLCGCAPHQAVMVGDHLKNDIGGAQLAGLKAYWFNPKDLDLRPEDPAPDGQIKELSGIISLLEPRLP